MSGYNREYSRRLSGSVRDLHKDLDFEVPADDRIRHSHSSTPFQLTPDETPVPSARASYSSAQNVVINDAVYKVLPSSTMSPKGTRITVQEDNGDIKVLDLERVSHSQPLDARHSFSQSPFANVDANANAHASPLRRASAARNSVYSQGGPSPNRASLFGTPRFSSGTPVAHQDKPAHASLSEFPLLERIPIIGKQSYNATVKELRSRLNALQNLSLKLHSGAKESLFDSLQSKVVKLSQSARVHQHELDGMRLEIEYLLNEIISQQNMREELYQKVEQHEEGKRQLLEQIRAGNAKLHQQHEAISEWRNKNTNRQSIIEIRDRKMGELKKRLAYQSAEIDHGKKTTEKNLQRLQAHIKRLNSDLKHEKDSNDNLRFKLNGANLRIHQFGDDIKALDAKILFFKDFKLKAEAQQDQIAELQIAAGESKDRRGEAQEALERAQAKLEHLALDNAELKAVVARLDDGKLTLEENLGSVGKELEARSSELKAERELKEAEARMKEQYRSDFENERKLKLSLEDDYSRLTETFKEKLSQMEAEISGKEMACDELRDQCSRDNLACRDKLEAKAKEHRDSVHSIKGEYMAQCKEYEARVIRMSKEHGELQTALAQKKTDYAKLSTIWENDQNTIKSMSQQMEHGRRRIERLIADGHHKTQQLEETRLDVKNLKNECGQLGQAMDCKESLVQNQNMELSDLRKRINELLDLLDAKDTTVNEYTLQVRKLTGVREQYTKVSKEAEEMAARNSKLTAALQSEKAICRKLDEKLKSASKSFSEMMHKDQEELNKLNKLLKEAHKESAKKQKKGERLAISLEDVKRNAREERTLLQDTVDRLKADHANLKRGNDSSKELWEKRIKSLTKKLERQEDCIEVREKEIMRMSIDMAKIKSQIAITAQSTYVSRTPSLDKDAHDGVGNAKHYLVDQLNQQKDEISKLYVLLNETKSKKATQRHCESRFD